MQLIWLLLHSKPNRVMKTPYAKQDVMMDMSLVDIRVKVIHLNRKKLANELLWIVKINCIG